LIRSTINLAHALGLRVVAEGVEEQKSLDLLSSFGCDVAQGYLISRPKPAGEVSFYPEPALSSGSSKGSALQVGAARRESSRHRPAPHPSAAPDERGGQWGYGPLPSTGNL
jgi:predicted signal transduction protein with EAL and GGDEF domain